MTATAPRIHVLPSALADQIAAGEVVERPASVVKELVENALDAGATRIEVEIAGGGRELVRVVDDGAGMTPEEAHLALQRHATSKLQSFEQLLDLRTMGFRGEALPSIAAVSRLTLTTRPAGSIEGYRLTVEAAVESPGRAIGAPRGTQVEVRDLFYNVPARLKFLKADATETAHVGDTVIRLALAHPGVHFRLRTVVTPAGAQAAGGAGTAGARATPRVAVDLPPHRSVLERAIAALGRRGAVHLQPAHGQEGAVSVTACLGAPTDSGNTARNTYLLVNRRTVHDRGLLHALALGYGELLERGRYPLAVLHVEVGPGAVDVNVHPQKTEVRFARPQEVQAVVRHVVRAACARAPWLGEPAGLRVYHLPPEPTLAARDRARDDARLDEALALFPTRPVASPAVDDAAAPASGAAERGVAGGARGEVARLAGEEEAPPLPGADTTADDRGPAPPAFPFADGAPIRLGGGGSVATPTPAAVGGRFFASLRYLGQVHRTYLVCEGAGELVLIDQHAAHERVAFERLKLAHQSKSVRTQRLLFSHVMELDESEAAAAIEQAAVLESLGFEIEPFAGRSFAVKTVPEALAAAPLDEMLRDVLDELAQRGASEVMADRLDHLFATMACHSVVRAGDVLDDVRVRALLDSMDGIDFRAHCPHGRPVLLRLSIAELERRFGR